MFEDREKGRDVLVNYRRTNKRTRPRIEERIIVTSRRWKKAV